MSNLSLRVGTRSSRLARVQTDAALRKIEALIPSCRLEDVALSSPGDRDRVADLRQTPADFFTRDLDEMTLAGELDCAVHSAKDVPDPVADGIDWCWLPWREDPRDVLIRPPGKDVASMPAEGTVGVSSERRESYVRGRFPHARQLPIRGNIEDRLRQLDEGQYDLVVMAGCALKRLGLEERITAWIPCAELCPPDGQGVLAMTFRAGDERLLRLRSLLVKAVTFAAAGVGSAGTCTTESLAALRRCDVCLHDVLLGPELVHDLPPHVERIHVGKRSGSHSVPQEQITRLIALHARRGRRVVRLKGGDPGIFGRLAEEIDVLDALHLPYRVLPGVTSLTAATTGTGMLLTRRGVSRGFSVLTPRKKGGGIARVTADQRTKLPLVFYMAISVADEVSKQLIEDGMPPRTPAAAVFGAGSDQCDIIAGELGNIAGRIAAAPTTKPGLLVVGDIAAYRYGRQWGALGGRRVLLTASRALQDKAAGEVADYGGVPVSRPLIELETTPEGIAGVDRIPDYDWIVLTSPSAVRCFGDTLRAARIDVRTVPKLVSCGGGTSRELEQMGFRVDIAPGSDFGAQGLLKEVAAHVTPGLRVLRLRSDKAGPGLAQSLRELGAEVNDCVLYRNRPIDYDTQPEFDVVFFASASAVEVFDAQWDVSTLQGRTVGAIGKPTLSALRERGVRVDVTAPQATVESAIRALAGHCVGLSLAPNDRK